MPLRLVNSPVLVVRNGAQVQPTVGKPFDFTDAEVKEINGLNAAAISHIVTEDKPATVIADAKK